MGCSNSAHEQTKAPVIRQILPPKLTDICGAEGFRSPESLPRECFGQRLGAGAYAKVYAVHRSAGFFPHSPFAQKPLAAKVIQFHAQNGQTAQVRYEKALREADVWECICKESNSGVVALVETFLDHNSVIFIMERCEVTLAKHMTNCPKLDECLIAGFLKQMLRSIQHIHSCDVIHRDVKPDNFLVGANHVLKISDFGLAVVSDNIWEKGNEPHPITNPNATPMVAGTAPFMSPEMLSRVVYSTQTDIWSVGAISYVVLIGQFPYMPKEMSTSSMKNAIRTGQPAPLFQPGHDTLFPSFPKGSYNGPSKEAEAFMVSALTRDVAARPTAIEALGHPYLTRSLSDEDVVNLPCLHCMFKRATRCGAFETVKPTLPPVGPTGSPGSGSASQDGISSSRRLSSEPSKGSRKHQMTADTTAGALRIQSSTA